MPKQGLPDAIEQFKKVIDGFKKELLPRIYAILKDDKIDSTKLNRTLAQLKTLSVKIEELLGIKSQLKGASVAPPPPAGPNEEALTDTPEKEGGWWEKIKNMIPRLKGAKPEEGDPESPEVDDVKKLKDPRRYVQEAKRLLPYSIFSSPQGLPEATPAMYDAFMMLYAAIISQWHNPGEQTKAAKKKRTREFTRRKTEEI